jgi:hypothetical protein
VRVVLHTVDRRVLRLTAVAPYHASVISVLSVRVGRLRDTSATAAALVRFVLTLRLLPRESRQTVLRRPREELRPPYASGTAVVEFCRIPLVSAIAAEVGRRSNSPSFSCRSAATIVAH